MSKRWLKLAIHNTLQEMFGDSVVGPELLEGVNQFKGWVFYRLAPCLSKETFENVRKAVAYLYPPSPHFPFDASQPPPANATPPNWRQVNALLRLWALLLSDEARASFQAVSKGELSTLDAYFHDTGIEGPLDDFSRLNFVYTALQPIHRAYNQLFFADRAKPLRPLEEQDVFELADFYKGGGEYPSHRLSLEIDCLHDTESILAAVRQTIESTQRELTHTYHGAWDAILGDDNLITHDPVKDFTLKEKGVRARSLQVFVGVSVEKLLVFALRQNMESFEINARFFPKWSTDKGPDCRPKAAQISRKYKEAVDLIKKAQAGGPMQS